MYGQTGAWRVPGYTEMRELGSGAGGQVVLARHDADGTLVAIKYLTEDLRSDLGFVARFRHEARLLALMERNPFAARFYEYVEHPAGAAIVMELVDGVSLRAMLRSEGPTGPEAALLILKGALSGLGIAHEIGVIHRDFKPENIMVEADGTSKIVDFGVAVRAGDGTNVAGTPAYMSPEQWAGAAAGPATDVYAATVVFFECLTGTRPFRAGTLPALARQHQTQLPPVEEVPQQLQGLIERGMAKHPSERPASAQVFLRELEAIAAETYGPAWEERGRRRLAALAGLLLPFFPLTEEAPEVDTSLAQTRLKQGPLSNTLVKIGLTVLAMGVIAGGTAALVGSISGATLQAGTTEISGSPSASAASAEEEEPIEEAVDEVTEEPTEKPAATEEPTPAAAAPTATAPAARPTRTATATPKPSPKPSASPSRTRKPSPSPSEDPRQDSTFPPGDPAPTRTATASPTPTRPTATPTTPTAAPTTPTSAPTTPTDVPQINSVPVGTSSPTPGPDPLTGAFALGLMTTGLVPATLALKRMTGRHRRRR